MTSFPLLPQGIDTVLFDMDGVLFDSMPIHAISWHETALHYGLKATRDEFYLYEGQKGVDTVRYLYERQHGVSPSDALVEEIYHHKTSLFRHTTEVHLIPGVRDLITYLRAIGLRTGVVTGSSRENAMGRLERYYSDLIDLAHVITADDCTQGKPSPEPYQRGMDLLASAPATTVVVENAPYGVASASAAETFVVAVQTGPIPSDRLYAEGAHWVAPDMAAVLAWWQQQ